MSEQAKRVNKFGEVDTDSICYWKNADRWYIYFPELGAGELSLHQVAEHEDGTISVTPSIRTWNERNQRHGYLTKGLWSEC